MGYAPLRTVYVLEDLELVDTAIVAVRQEQMERCYSVCMCRRFTHRKAGYCPYTDDETLSVIHQVVGGIPIARENNQATGRPGGRLRKYIEEILSPRPYWDVEN